MLRHRLSVGETHATLLLREKRYVDLAEEQIHRVRNEIIAYGDAHPEFLWSLQPVEIDSNCSQVIARMAAAANQFEVGPMASVAGAIAQEVVSYLVERGCDHVVFDNGGDIAMYISEPAIVGVYTGLRSIPHFGFKIEHTDSMRSMCTSSLTVGHSLSLGLTDVSLVYTDDATMADAAATALGNSVQDVSRQTVEASLKQIMNQKVLGAMVVVGDIVGHVGRLPTMVAARVDPRFISCG
jgi:hypothetical protein